MTREHTPQATEVADYLRRLVHSSLDLDEMAYTTAPQLMENLADRRVDESED